MLRDDDVGPVGVVLTEHELDDGHERMFARPGSFAYSALVPEEMVLKKTFMGGSTAAVLDAVAAATKAADLGAALVFLEARWPGRRLNEQRFDQQIRAILLEAGEPELLSIFLVAEGRGQIGLVASDGRVTVNASGTDPEVLLRGFSAAETVIAKAGGVEQEVIQEAPVAPVVRPQDTTTRWQVFKSWCEENQGLIAAVGLVVAVAGIIAGLALQ